MTAPTRILLVEDNAIDVRLVCFALDEQESWKTQVSVAVDGDKAIQYLLENPGGVDLVILDLNLPGRDGTEVLKIIRSTEFLASLPIIILSSLPEDVSEEQVKAMHLKANSYLRKPVGAKEFMQLGARILEGYRLALSGGNSPYASHAG